MPSWNPQLCEGCKDTSSCAGQGCAGRRKGLNAQRLETRPLPPIIWAPQARERLTDSGVSAPLSLNRVDVCTPERAACGQWTASRLLCTNRPRTGSNFGRGDLAPACSVATRGWVTRAALRTPRQVWAEPDPDSRPQVSAGSGCMHEVQRPAACSQGSCNLGAVCSQMQGHTGRAGTQLRCRRPAGCRVTKVTETHPGRCLVDIREPCGS